MLVDIPFERGFSEIDERFGDTRKCHFPLFDFLKPLPFAWMCLAYLTMWIGECVNFLTTAAAPFINSLTCHTC